MPRCATSKNAASLYEEVDITSTPGATEKVAELTGGPVIVPVVVDDTEVRFGFGGT